MLTKLTESYYTLSELALRADVSIDHLRKLCRTGKLKSTRVGGIRGPHMIEKELGDEFITNALDKKSQTKEKAKPKIVRAGQGSTLPPEGWEQQGTAKMDKIMDMALTSLEMKMEQLEEQISFCKYHCPHSKNVTDKFHLIRDREESVSNS